MSNTFEQESDSPSSSQSSVSQSSEDAKPILQDSVQAPTVPFSDNIQSSFSDDIFADDLLSYPAELHRAKWSVSWSDLMMTMFIFFAVLYIYKSGSRELEFGEGVERQIHGQQENLRDANLGHQKIADSASGAVVEKQIEHKPSEIYDQALKALKDRWVDESLSVELVKDEAVRLTLSSDLFFDIGKAELKPEAKWELKNVADFLKENSFIINVAGHTDSTPNHSAMFPTNWELSAARACRVARFLIENGGVEESRFFISGHSWLQPIAPNNSASNRALNRRVEILLMKDMPYERK